MRLKKAACNCEHCLHCCRSSLSRSFTTAMGVGLLMANSPCCCLSAHHNPLFKPSISSVRLENNNSVSLCVLSLEQSLCTPPENISWQHYALSTGPMTFAEVATRRVVRCYSLTSHEITTSANVKAVLLVAKLHASVAATMSGFASPAMLCHAMEYAEVSAHIHSHRRLHISQVHIA